MLGMLITSAIARREGKPAFFFSRFNFTRMRDAGNTHYCFNCGGMRGFQIDETGAATNIHTDDSGLNEKHSAACASATIGNADKYDNPWDWLAAELPADFPHIVDIPNIN